MANRSSQDLDALLTVCWPLRAMRDRRLAHEDMATQLSPHDQPLPVIPLPIVNQALSHIRAILNTVEGSFRDSETAYQAVTLRGEAKALLLFLRKGVEASERDRNEALARPSAKG